MKLSDNGFKSITKKADIEAEALKGYLGNLYGDPNYEEKDKAYVEDTDPAAVNEYRGRADILVKKLVELSGLPEFAKLSKHFTKNISRGELRETVHHIKGTSEMICYELQHLHDQGKPVPYQFKAALGISTIDACEPGALTNVQNILFSLSDSLYGLKYSFIQNFVTEYVEKHNLYEHSGDIVHFVNGLMDKVSGIYGLTIPQDLYLRRSNNSVAEEFVRHIEKELSGREGAYKFAGFLAQYYAGNLPNIPNDGMPMKDKNDHDVPGVEQISMLCQTLNMSMSDLCYNTRRYNPIKKKDEDVIYYKEDYLLILEAAVTYKLIREGIIEQKECLVEKEYTTTIPKTIYLKDEKGKFLRDEGGRLVTKTVPGTPITLNKPIIESPGAWFLSSVTSEEASTISIQEKILDTNHLNELTKYGRNFLDWLHDELKDPLNQGLKFDKALSSLISQKTLTPEDIDLNLTENEESKEDLTPEDINLNPIEKADNNEGSKDDLELGDIQLEDQKDDNISKKLFLLSDQIELIQEYRSKEEIESMSINDLTKWLGFIDSLKRPETPDKIDSILKYIALDGKASMLDVYINSADDGLRSKILDRIQNFVDTDGNRLLHLAALKNNVDLVPKLMSYYYNAANIPNFIGRSPLYYANNEEMISLLIKNDANVNYEDLDRKTPLHFFVQEGKINLIELLIKNGANIHAEDQNGETPVSYAVDKQAMEMISLLESKGADLYGELMRYIKQGRFKSAEFLLSLDIKNHKKDEGRVLNARDVYKFVEFLAQHYEGNLPVHLSNGTGLIMNDANNEDREIIISILNEVCNGLNTSKDSLFNYLDGGTKLCFKKDSKSRIEALFLLKMINSGLVESHGSLVEKKSGREVIEAPNALYFSRKNEDGKVIIEDEILDTKYLKGLTKSGQNFEDYLRDSLKYYLDQGYGFDIAISELISQTNNNQESQEEDVLNLSLDKKLFLLSDQGAGNQGKVVKKYRSIYATKMAMSEEEKSVWLELDYKLMNSDDISSVLKYLAQSGNLSILNAYLSSLDQSSLNEATSLMQKLSNTKEDNLLELAFKQKNIDIITYFIGHVTDLNVKHEALINAIKISATDVINILIKGGADLTRQDINGNIALRNAIEVGNIDVIDLVLNNIGDGKSFIDDMIIYWAQKNNNTNAISLLASKGGDIHTPLMRSIKDNNFERVKFLLNCNFDVNKPGINELRLLTFVANEDIPTEEKLEILKSLINKGADPNIQNKNGYTPLHYAAAKENTEIMELLINAGANVNHETKDGRTLLRDAIDKGDIKIISLLINNGANVNYESEYGLPLQDAIIRGNEKIISLLIDNGANVNYESEYGLTPLREAIIEGNEKIISLLISKGADVNQADTPAKTPLNILLKKYENDVEKLADILKENKDPQTIVNLIKKSAGYLWDDEKHWKIIKAIVENLPKEERVDVVYEAVNLIWNTSRRARLSNMLTKEEQLDLRRKLDLIKNRDTFIDTYGGFGSEDENIKKESFVEKEKAKRKNSFQDVNNIVDK